MTFEFNCTGSDRKKLVQLISEAINATAKYKGAPTFAYEVGYITVGKTGDVHMNDMADDDEVEKIMHHLKAQGYSYTSFSYDNPQPEPDMVDDRPEEDCPPPYATPDADDLQICIKLSRDLFTDDALNNLRNLIEAKAGLMKKAFCTPELPLLIDETTVGFPWFSGKATPEEIKAYEHFICKLGQMACNQKRVTAKEKEVDNEKYAFRCFLLRLGFIGSEYKTARKILLKNLSGSSAFKSGATKGEEIIPMPNLDDLTPAQQEALLDELLLQQVNEDLSREGNA